MSDDLDRIERDIHQTWPEGVGVRVLYETSMRLLAEVRRLRASVAELEAEVDRAESAHEDCVCFEHERQRLALADRLEARATSECEGAERLRDSSVKWDDAVPFRYAATVLREEAKKLREESK